MDCTLKKKKEKWTTTNYTLLRFAQRHGNSLTFVAARKSITALVRCCGGMLALPLVAPWGEGLLAFHWDWPPAPTLLASVPVIRAESLLFLLSFGCWFPLGDPYLFCCWDKYLLLDCDSAALAGSGCWSFRFLLPGDGQMPWDPAYHCFDVVFA